MAQKIYTSESVTEGHPDKICDVIADTLVDAFLKEDKFARVDCSALVTRGFIVVSGEVSTKCYININDLIRSKICDIGYDSPECGFDYRSIGVMTLIREQDEHLGKIVDMRMAGDQGMMVGFATDEATHLGCSLEYMPVPIAIAHRLMKRLTDVRKNGTLAYLRPDGKGQVTVAYDDGKPTAITSVVVAAQHSRAVDVKQVEKDVTEHVIAPVFNEIGLPMDAKTLHVNPGGPFTEGGPLTDTGETGRKIVVDAYGSLSRHGGSAFSGKDPTKLDRSGAYMARYLAKNVVASGAASRCEVQLAYYIGNPDPVSIVVDTHGTAAVNDEKIARLITDNFDLTPAGILEHLDLRKPIYLPTAAYGHFGRTDYDFPWERCDATKLFGKLKKGSSAK